MRNTRAGAGRTAVAVAAAGLLAGCGTSSAGTAAAETASADAGPKAVLADVRAAVRSAGLPEREVVEGFPEQDVAEVFSERAPDSGLDAGQRRKVAALTRELAPCHVSWATGPTGPTGNDPAERRQEFEAVLAGFEARGWKERRPVKEVEFGDDGTLRNAVHHKRGWTTYAQHTESRDWIATSVMVTQDSCFDRLTDEEEDLLERAFD
ncbi:hypothetical protein [Streptomyces sp. NPDC047130]|uniref:hypothetical protein n=1 Tax=Streptomyces sp. NPDC047130 TaxID=3155261 RepID=UPI0033C4E6A7